MRWLILAAGRSGPQGGRLPQATAQPGGGRHRGSRRARSAAARRDVARRLFAALVRDPAAGRGDIAVWLASTLAEGTGPKLVLVDGLGIDLAPGAAAYGATLRRQAEGFRACLPPRV